VATAAEDRLSFKRNPRTSFAAASDCRTIAIYELHSLGSGEIRPGDDYDHVARRLFMRGRGPNDFWRALN
jgi:hypothetical protein